MSDELQPKYPWWPYQPLVAWENRLGQSAEKKGGLPLFCYEFIRFGVKQAWACLFGGLLLALLVGTHLWYPKDAFLTRYDFLVISAILIQAMMLACRMETLEEAKVILLFHITGTVMEIFKTHMGSWQYPEAGHLKIVGVPLFSGFMYASVGSYIARVWRLFDFSFTYHPYLRTTVALSVAIYINFFTHHYVYDFRWAILAVLAFSFRKTWIYFRIRRHYRRMPLLLGFFLAAAFIWFAENICTFTNVWLYPNQMNGWHMVPMGKLVSWYMLMIISYVMVSFVNKPTPFQDR
ncbi:MAG: DUF817 domain-containing protein [Azoarcus sp.]|jgi:uncharacterized membrane protein YoaT (DUF817 family)|nr:DUF817 domain-containing protein [Azoarcus sp.]